MLLLPPQTLLRAAENKGFSKQRGVRMHTLQYKNKQKSPSICVFRVTDTWLQFLNGVVEYGPWKGLWHSVPVSPSTHRSQARCISGAALSCAHDRHLISPLPLTGCSMLLLGKRSREHIQLPSVSLLPSLSGMWCGTSTPAHLRCRTHGSLSSQQLKPSSHFFWGLGDVSFISFLFSFLFCLFWSLSKGQS